jgi:hypothetical protein
MTSRSEFAIRQPDGTWAPCDVELNRRINDAMEDFERGLPGSVTVRDEDGNPHTLSGAADQVLYLALLMMDARLRPGGCYREKADEIYALLAAGPLHADGVQELRRVFQLGAKRPWLVP